MTSRHTAAPFGRRKRRQRLGSMDLLAGFGPTLRLAATIASDTWFFTIANACSEMTRAPQAQAPALPCCHRRQRLYGGQGARRSTCSGVNVFPGYRWQPLRERHAGFARPSASAAKSLGLVPMHARSHYRTASACLDRYGPKRADLCGAARAEAAMPRFASARAGKGGMSDIGTTLLPLNS